MKVAIILVTFNGKKDTLECLQTLQKLEHEDYTSEIIVVDNASEDHTGELIKEKYPQVKLLTNTVNQGFAQGNNTGIKYALDHGVDYILLLNNDTIVQRDLIKVLVNVAKPQVKGGIFCPKIYFAPGYETHANRYSKNEIGKVIWYAGGSIDWANMLASHRGVDEVDKGQYDEMAKTGYATGCALFVRSEVFRKIGLLDPKFYLYYEDLDLCQRARKAGYEIFYVPKAVLWHKNASSSGGTGSDTQSYYITRNRLFIGMRYAPWRTKLALFREATNLLMHGTTTQKQAIGDFLRKYYGKRRPRFSMPKMVRLPQLPKMPNLLNYVKRPKEKKP